MARTASKNRSAKSRQIQKIHVLAHNLGMDTKDKDPKTTYRSMLWTVARVTTASDLDYAGRCKVLNYLENCLPPGQRKRRAPGFASYREISMVRGLWAELGEIGALDEPGEQSLRQFIQRNTDVHDVQFLKAIDANNIIEGLKKMRDRHTCAELEKDRQGQ